MSRTERKAEYEGQLQRLDAEWRRLDGQRMSCIAAIVIGGAVFVGNMTGATGPENGTLGTFSMIAVVGGAIVRRAYAEGRTTAQALADAFDVSSAVAEIRMRELRLAPSP